MSAFLCANVIENMADIKTGSGLKQCIMAENVSATVNSIGNITYSSIVIFLMKMIIFT